MKKLLFLLSATMVFLLNACGDDSSSNAKNDVAGSSESIVESSATETAKSSSSEVENIASSSSESVADSTGADEPTVDFATSEKMLVAYYSFTGNSKAIVETLTGMISADVVEISPVEKADFAANNYAIGDALIDAINKNPDDESSYPAITASVEVSFANYSEVIVVAPLWWSQMAAPMQTYLFKNSNELANKKVGLIVSSHSSGISGVEADAKRLLPGSNFTASLSIKATDFSSRETKIADWLKKEF